MQSLCLALARLALGAWVGAAALFVAASVREQASTELSAQAKSHLAALRFPLYYGFGFALVGTGLACTALSRGHAAIRRRRRAQFCLVLVAAALALMIVDYVWIYGPLHEMMLEDARPPRFHRLHKASQYVNFADVGLCLAAAVALGWPARSGEGVE